MQPFDARGWEHEQGFERAFYVEDSIEVAAQKAVDRKLLSSREATSEKAILLLRSYRSSAIRARER